MSSLSSRKCVRHWFGKLPALLESAFRRAYGGMIELMPPDEVVVHVVDHLGRPHHALSKHPAALPQGADPTHG